jgi:hypothetical protein
VKYLLEQGAEPTAIDSSENSVIHYAAAYGAFITALFRLVARSNARSVGVLVPFLLALGICVLRMLLRVQSL